MKKLHIEDLHSLYRSHDIVRVIKCRRLRWTGSPVRIEEDRRAIKILTYREKTSRKA